MMQEHEGYRRVFSVDLPCGGHFLYVNSNGMGCNDMQSPIKYTGGFETAYASDDFMIIGNHKTNDYLLIGAVTAWRSQTHLILFLRAKEFDTIEIWQPDLKPEDPPEEIVELRGSDWIELLRQYAGIAALKNQVELPSYSGNITGYCTWYYYYKDVTAADFFENVETFGKDRSAGGYPAELIQIDDGYQTFQGDWLDRSTYWPEPLEKVCRRIEHYGMTPGIWLMPFIASTASRVYHEHPEWFVCDEDGKLNVSQGWTPAPDHLWAALDLTLPEVQDHLKNIFRTFRKWGFRYFKLDGLAFALKKGKRHDPDATPVSAFRQGLKLIREAVPDALLLSCCPAYLPCLGLTQMARISDDTKAEAGILFRSMHVASSRWWMIDRWFLADPDVMIARSDRSTLTEGENRISVLMGCLTGVALTSDNLKHLSAEQHGLLCRGARLRLKNPHPFGTWDFEKWIMMFRGTIDGQPGFAAVNDSEQPVTIKLHDVFDSEYAEELLIPQGVVKHEIIILPHDAILLKSKIKNNKDKCRFVR